MAARRLLTEGLSLAEQGRFDVAEASLRRAVHFDDELDPAWSALGMCALLRGDLLRAGTAWRRAAMVAPDGPAADWLASLKAGDARRAVSGYNAALDLAHRGAYDEALGRLADVHASLPAFLPALRLEGLMYAARGCAPADYATWCARASAWATDPDVTELRSRLESRVMQRPVEREAAVGRHASASRSIARRAAGLAAVAGAAGFVLGRVIAPSPVPSWARRPAAARVALAEQPPRPTETDGDAGRARVRAALDAAVRGDRLATATLIDSVGTEGSGWTDAGRQRAQALLRSRAVQEYADGRRALGQRDTLAAITHFASAAHGSTTYIADDALYELMLLQETRGNASEARTTARDLLLRFPASIFANSRTRRTAALPKTVTAR